MTRRRRRLLGFAIIAVLAGLLPPVLMLTLSHRIAERNAVETLDGYAAVLQNRALEVFRSGEATLSEMAQRIDRNCTDNSVQELRKAVYRSLYFREAGLVYGQALQCTSEQVFDPPIPIANPDHLVMPADGIHIAAPQITLEGEVSIVLLYRVTDGIAVNLLLNPQHLTEPLLGAVNAEHVRLVIERSDGILLAQFGATGTDDVIRASSQPPGYPVRVIVSASRAWMMRDWARNLRGFFGIGLLLSLPIFLLLKRVERREQTMDVQIRDALEAGELRVHYQPIHSIDGLRVVGVEALMRWQHPRRGLILPGAFIPVAEENGFILPLTHWLMRTVCTEMAALLDRHPDLYLALNLSPRHFADPELPQLIRNIFAAPFAAGRLVFEVTERELMDSRTQTASDVMDLLRRDGSRVALDDFGTGYSSLQYLAQFKFDLLKIDKAFVDAIGTESVTAGLVDDMVAMSKRLGMKAVAEGVETAAQLHYLQQLGIEYVQGWYFSEALPLDQLETYLARHANPR
ncbi:MAG: EAL domain-containing protein [Nevskia sp.]